MHFLNYKELNEYCAKIDNKRCILKFSRGKESIACWLILKKFFDEIIPVHEYLIPNLSFVDESLAYYEDFFKAKIINVPAPNLYKMLNNGVYQTSDSWRAVKKFGLPNFDYHELLDWIREDYAGPKTPVAVGVRASDSPTRYMVVKRHGSYIASSNTFYPVFDFKIADLNELFRQEKVKLPVDYELFGKSFDGIDYRFLKPIKDNFPQDYEKIKEFFPLIDIEILRYGL